MIGGDSEAGPGDSEERHVFFGLRHVSHRGRVNCGLTLFQDDPFPNSDIPASDSESDFITTDD
jgi:hypothetical protein